MISHARHFLRRSHPKFGQFAAVLNQALAGRSSVAVAEDDDHNIVDVRPSSPFVPSASRSLAKGGLADSKLTAPATTISLQQATELFALVSGQSCNPLAITTTCIPFLYPDDGCWARAHEMSRLMIARGVRPNKRWIYGRLHVQTRNKPNCAQDWGWHVAPTLQVQMGGGTQTMVIDPSMFTIPVPDPVWRGAQNDATAVFATTDASIFYRSLNGEVSTDPTYAGTTQVLAQFRAQLKLRTATVGPPPYANCTALV
nr:protein-glutamine glutaminase family protein [Bradyrhizobium sp. 21]